MPSCIPEAPLTVTCMLGSAAPAPGAAQPSCSGDSATSSVGQGRKDAASSVLEPSSAPDAFHLASDREISDSIPAASSVPQASGAPDSCRAPSASYSGDPAPATATSRTVGATDAVSKVTGERPGRRRAGDAREITKPGGPLGALECASRQKRVPERPRGREEEPAGALRDPAGSPLLRTFMEKAKEAANRKHFRTAATIYQQACPTPSLLLTAVTFAHWRLDFLDVPACLDFRVCFRGR